MRYDGRKAQELRKLELQMNVFEYPEGSVVIRFDDATAICSATIEDSVSLFLKGMGTGWATAEYNILPRATSTRNRGESSRGRLSGRTIEIQRFTGHSLRAVVDLEKLGGRSIVIDRGVIQVNGGTRTTNITGAFVVLKLAIEKLLREKESSEDPIKGHLAAVSVGILPDGTYVTDSDYQGDSAALVDMDLVMTESGEFVEIQGTGEETTFDGE